MPAQRLTERALNALAPANTLWDHEVRGLGARRRGEDGRIAIWRPGERARVTRLERGAPTVLPSRLLLRRRHREKLLHLPGPRRVDGAPHA